MGDGSGRESLFYNSIDNANDGDSVFVAAGEYVENINFNGKNIALPTIINGDQFLLSITEKQVNAFLVILLL